VLELLSQRLFLMFFTFLRFILSFPYTFGSSSYFHLLRVTFSFFISLMLMYLLLMFLMQSPFSFSSYFTTRAY
jgi:hypothetical protein